MQNHDLCLTIITTTNYFFLFQASWGLIGNLQGGGGPGGDHGFPTPTSSFTAAAAPGAPGGPIGASTGTYL